MESSLPPSMVLPPSAVPAVSPKLSPRRGAPEGIDLAGVNGQARPLKRLRQTSSLIETCSDLKTLLLGALPGKEAFVADWLSVLASPSVCVTCLEDVRRLDPKDIPSLPIPPLVKGVFREVLDVEASKAEEQHLVLDATKQSERAFFAPLRDRNMQPPLAGSKYFQDLEHYRLILTAEEILTGVRIVARRVETWSKGERIILVAILKGAFMFLSDLCRQLVRPYSVYFVEASSYGNERKQGGGGVAISSDIQQSKFFDSTTKKPHKIILIDELLDNGKTMEEMKQHFLTTLSATHTNDDILTAVLFSKKRGRTYPDADVTGISDLPDLWLVGYGLDDRGTKRGWTDLFAIPKVKIVETIDKQEAEKLLNNLDDNATLTSPLLFAGVELQFNHKQKYRLHGVEVMKAETGSKQLNGAMKPTNLQKSDLMETLSNCPTIKGKFEHAIRFAFIPVGMSVVPEDEIFSGNKLITASMRCGLRKQITTSAQRFGVPPLEPVTRQEL